ncbi:HD domain-containing protein [Arcanobacterium canis]
MLENEKVATAAVPDWVIRSFVRSAINVGADAHAKELAHACRALIEIWSTPDRKVHNMTHVMDMLTRIDTLAPETRDPDCICLATWYHGVVFSVDDHAVYAHNGGEDELASAAVAREDLAQLGIPQATCESIATLITSLHHRHSSFSQQLGETSTFDAVDSDQIALRDAHLGVLASDPKRYKKYNALTREEYAGVDDVSYYRARSRILTRLLSRKRLFISPLAADWELNARQNATAELERIKAFIEANESAVSDTTYFPLINESESPCNTSTRTTKESTTSAPKIHDEVGNALTAQLLAQSEPEDDENFDADGGADEVPHIVPFRRLTAEEFRSTLEDPDDSFEPGVQPTVLSGPEAEAVKREKIARDTLDIIASKRRCAKEARKADVAKDRSSSAQTSTMEKADSVEDSF